MATLKYSLRNIINSSDLHPLVLRVTDLGRSNLITLKINCKKEHWNDTKQKFNKSFPDHKAINELLNEFKIRAERIIRSYEKDEIDYSFKKFKKDLFHYKKKNSNNVFDFWDEYIESFSYAGRVGNARFQSDCKNTFLKFTKNPNLQFNELNYNILEKYEFYLRNKGNVPNGIAVRMRGIRAMINNAIEKGYATNDEYPFKKYKISKLKGEPKKRALVYDEIVKIKDFNLSEYPNLIDSRNYFIFSYYARGMNFYDLLLLKWKNITKESLSYTRHKTQKEFIIKLNPVLSDILNFYKKNSLNTEYVFPLLLKDNLDPQQIENRKHKTLSKYNKDLKEIAQFCNIHKNVTSYVARHSFATNLKEKGISTDIISEAMGHQNLAITQAYLKSFGNEIIDDAVDVLL